MHCSDVFDMTGRHESNIDIQFVFFIIKFSFRDRPSDNKYLNLHIIVFTDDPQFFGTTT